MNLLHHEIDEADGNDEVPTLVLLHPLGADLRIWDDCRARWRGTFRMVSYDRSGAGSSPTPDHPYALDDHVDELEALRAGLGIEAMIPVGNAIGALVAAAYTARHPDRVPALVLCDAAVAVGGAGLALVEERMAKVTDGGMAAIVPDAVDRAFHNQPHDERYDAYLARFAAQDPAGYVHSTKSCLGADLNEAYAAIACPVLVLVGRDDLLFPPAEAERVAALLAHAELVVLDGVAHFPPYQAPDRIAELVADFAARHIT